MLPIEPQRVTEPVVVGTDADGVATGAGHQRVDRVDGDTRLVAEQQHDPLRIVAHVRQCRPDRGGAAVAEVRVEHGVGAGQVDADLHLLRGPAERDDHLVERRLPGRGQGGVEQRRATEGE